MSEQSIEAQDVYVAHVKRVDNSDEWDTPHDLEEHLLGTACLARQFAGDIGACWAELAGKWHDLGKYRKRFQDYIRKQSGYEQSDYERENAHIENGQRAPHSTAGAIHAVKHLPSGLGHILAYLIAGHHAGLPDWFGGKGSLEYRLKEGRQEYEEALCAKIPEKILEGNCPDVPQMAESKSLSKSLWIRMLFSCLVDADFLDTEKYMRPDKSAGRESKITVTDLSERFERSFAQMRASSEEKPLNKIRNEINSACLKAAEQKPGLFSLTVPTGGGKTLASLAFALKHARLHDKRRIVYAIPFTSIIEQNAAVFREFLGDDAVLEHHSNIDVKEETARSRLASENWDAPLIVTTNVQLFESLYASKTSKCRKLHNLIGSIIILDEAQQLPRDFHAPFTEVMQQMSDYFGVTWVLCTATQPVLSKSQDNFGRLLIKGLNNVREIIPEPEKYFTALQRVSIEFPQHEAPARSREELAEEIRKHECVLTIVNTRKQARQLAELVSPDCLHLSANMCAEHRTQVLDEIKQRLEDRRIKNNSLPLRVVSTQLVEAGVDVDFPVVYRAMAGLDSIAQSAGRCNREGNLKGLGRVVIFKAEQSAPPGYLRQGEDVTCEMLAGGLLDEHLTPKMSEKYFDRINSRGDRDKHQILKYLKPVSNADVPLGIQFREAAKKFHLIDDFGEAVVVPFIPNRTEDNVSPPIDYWISELERDSSQKWVYRKLQRYTVSLPKRVVMEYSKKGVIEYRAGLNVLLDGFYSQQWGIDLGDLIIPAEQCVL